MTPEERIASLERGLRVCRDTLRAIYDLSTDPDKWHDNDVRVRLSVTSALEVINEAESNKPDA